MRTRAWSVCLVLAGLGVACQDQPTGPEREPAQVPGNIALATATSEDGLSIVTDKDDYAPGDTVWFTGAGWVAGDSLDIVLTDDTQDLHEWAVGIAGDGTFRDPTYVVNEGDLNVTFTLTATSRATGRTLTVTFTDGNVTAATGPETHAPSTGTTCAAASKNAFTLGETVCAQTTITVQTPPAGPGIFRFQWVGPAPATTVEQESSKSGANGSTQVDQFEPTTAGTWTVRVCKATGNCASGGNLLASATFTVSGPVTPTKLAFVTDSRTAAVGQCTAVLTVQSQLADGTPANVSSSTTLGLTSTSAGGTFYTDAACTTTGTTSIAAGANSASFYYKDADAGTPTVKASASGLTDATQGETITAGNAQVGVTATPASPTVFGQSVSFKATVTAVAPAVGTPTGSVTFHDGATCSDPQIGASKTLAGGNATSDATTTLSVGSHTITACYGGGGGFTQQAGQATHEVNKAPTSVALAKSPVGNTVFSQPVVFTATVSVTAPGAGTPAGDVKFYELASGGTCDSPNGSLLGTETLASAQAQLSISTFPAASSAHVITACYQGNADLEASDKSISHTVDKAGTTSGVASSANPSVFSQSVTFDVTVTPNTPATATPVGNVILKDGTCAAGASLGATTALDASGKASIGVSSLAVGPHTVTACYLGSSNFEASDDDVSQVVNQAATSTAAASSVNPSVFSQSVSFTATVSPVFPATATPTGSVSFEEGGTACGTGTSILASGVALAGGVASFSTSALAAGAHTIRACYAETVSFLASDNSVSQTVNKAVTTTAVSTSGSPSILNQPVTFTATVSSVLPATATPVGNVTLKDGTCAALSSLGGPTALDGGGQASFPDVSSLAVGNHTVVACYAGNDNFNSSNGSVAQQVQYNFAGLYAPVDRPNTMNVSKAGQGIPLKWRLTDFNGAPVLNFAPAAFGVAVTMLPCDASASVDAIEEYAGNSGLQNLGDGYYQFNWKTPASYANGCRAIGLNLGEPTTRGPLAFFTFKK